MSPKPPRDPNTAAFQLMQKATGEYVSPKKRRGRAGAAARNDALTPERRKEIAQKAAAARWKKPEPTTDLEV